MKWMRPINIVVLAGALTLALTVGATAAMKGSMSLKGAGSNKLGSHFTYTVSGFAAAPANFVAVFHPADVSACLSTYRAELGQAHDYAGFHVKSKKHFSGKVRLKATIAGKRHLCAYLINAKSGKTYAHASARYKNHK